jgi:hypothetical protein
MPDIPTCRNEGENKHNGENWQTHRQKNPDERLKLIRPVDSGRFFHAGWNHFKYR